MKHEKITLALVDDHRIVIDGLISMLKGHDTFQFAFATTDPREVIDKLRRLHALCPELDLEREARAIDGCGCRARVFECMGQRELWEGESINRRHRIQKHVRCKRDFAPCCAEYNSPAHQERTNRIAKNFWGIRYAKWVVTVADADIELLRGQDELAAAQKIIGCTVARVVGAEGALVSLHVMGDKSDRYRPHWEVLVPHDGTPYDYDLFLHLKETLRKELTVALDLEESANVHFGYIGKGQPAKLQVKEWFHGIRYAVHPVVGAERFVRLPDAEAAFIVRLLRGLRRVRGYGVLSDRKIKGAAEELRKLYPIDLSSESEPEPEVYEGGPCPACFSRLKAGDMEHALAGGVWISPDLSLFEFIESIDISNLKPMEADDGDLDWSRALDDGSDPPDSQAAA